MGMRQKSATHTGGVARVAKSSILVVLLSEMVSPVKDSCCDILVEVNNRKESLERVNSTQALGR